MTYKDEIKEKLMAYFKSWDGTKNTNELCEEICEILSEKSYEDGLNDAWDCARKIVLMPCAGGFTVEEICRIFGNTNVLTNLTASEAVAKFKAYEEQENEIHVGDEVVSDAFDEKGIVTHITDKGCVSLICGMKSMISTGLDKIHKTGKSYPQIDEILEQLNGDKE